MKKLFPKKKSSTGPAKKFPKASQWKRFFKVLNKKERAAFFVLFLSAFLSGLFLSFYCYFAKTAPVAAQGGSYHEGVIGQPRLLNPLFLADQDADRDIVEILFAGLFKYNQQAELVPDLANDYQIEDEGKAYLINLKENLFWHDNEPLTADDVVFTVNLIQEPQSQSPLRIKWVGVQVEKLSANQVRFHLPKAYNGFLENLTLKIIPKHIFEFIPPQDLIWKLISEQYLIGSGPFKFKELKQNKAGQITKITLEKNESYHLSEPYLQEVVFHFYNNFNDLLKAAQIGDLNGLTLTDPGYFKRIEKNFHYHLLAIPRYFALFFNLKAKNIFVENEARKILEMAIDKENILKQVFLDKGQRADSPVLPEFFNLEKPGQILSLSPERAIEELEKEGFLLNPQTNKREKQAELSPAFTFIRNLTTGSQGAEVTELQKCLAKDPAIYPDGSISGYFGPKTKTAVIKFQEKYRDDILAPAGLKAGNGEVKPLTRRKLNEICFEKPTETVPLVINLTICDKFPFNEIAELLKNSWEEIGAEVNITKISIADFQTKVLSERDFEMLIFGEALGSIPDPFPFWHSSQKEAPGLNIASYQSKEADKLLETIRQSIDPEEQKQALEQFQTIFLEDKPAILLVRPDYVYLLSDQVKGFAMAKITEPAKRFSTVENWYIETKRVWR